MEENIIEAHQISKRYGSKEALRDVSFNVPRGSIFGLLGPNGAGKTTFIRILTQIIGPDSGQILLNGRSMTRDDIGRIGYMPEERGLYRRMKVGEQIVYLAQLKGLSYSQAMDAVQYWFSTFEIKDWWNKKVEELSKGMQQKIQFITTVIHKPELIILDEPFTGFDPVNTEIIKQEILKLNEQGATIILSSHRMESVEELCDYITLINRSEKVLDGAVDEVRHRFKEHFYEMVLDGVTDSSVLENNPGITISTMERKGPETYHMRFRVADNIATNDILRQVLTFGQVVSFREVLPSIHDIFVKLVREQVNE